MIISNPTRLKQLDTRIKRGAVRVVTVMRPDPTTADGEYWVLDDLAHHRTDHVLVALRPGWKVTD